MRVAHVPTMAVDTSRRWWLGVAVVVALIGAWFAVEVATGHVFVKTACLYERYYPWRHWTHGARLSAVELGCDIIEEGVAFRTFTAQELAHGRLPMWNPYVFTGSPLFAAPATGVLSPFTLLYAAIPMPLAWTVIPYLQIALAAWLMALFVRDLGASGLGAAAAAGLFALNGLFLELPSQGANIGTGLWLPLWAFAALRWWRTGRLRYPLIGAAVVTLQVFGGHYELLLYALFVVVAWSLLQEWRTPGTLGRRVARIAVWGGACAVGIQAALIQLVPFLELARNGQREPFESSLVSYPHWLSLLELVLPFENGGGLFYSLYHMPFIGVLPLAMVAVVALGWWRRAVDRAHAGFFLCLAAVTVLMGFGLFGFGKLFTILAPAARSTNRIFFPMHFAVAVVTALGLTLLEHGDRETRRRATRVCLAVAGVIAVLTLGGFILAELAARPGVRDSLLAAVLALRRRFGAVTTTATALQSALGLFGERFRPLTLTATIHLFPLYAGLLALMAAAVVGRATAARTRSVAKAVLMVALLAVPYHFVARVGQFGKLEELFPLSDTVRFLQTSGPVHQFRVISLDGPAVPGSGGRRLDHPGFTNGRVFSGNIPMAFGLHTVGGYHAMYPGGVYRVLRDVEPTLRRECRTDSCNKLYFTEAIDIGSPILDMLNVRYVVTRLRVDLAAAGLQPRFRSSRDDLAVWENPRALPRAYLVPQAVAGSPTMPAARRAADATPVVALSAAAIEAARNDASRVPVEVLRYEPQSITLRARADVPSYVVLADAYFPGWRASIDGRPELVLRANDVVRAVAVPAGQHDVVFRYEPDSFRRGAMLALLSPVSFGALAIVWRRAGASSA